MPETKTGREVAGSGFYVEAKLLEFGFPKVHICADVFEPGADISLPDCKSVMQNILVRLLP